MRTWATTHPAGAVIAFRTSDWDKLVYASHGVMTVRTEQGVWVVPPDRAVWVPAGFGHKVEMSGRVSVRTLYFARRIARALPRVCRAVNVTPLLRELVLRTIEHSMLRSSVGTQARLAALLIDEIVGLPTVPLQLIEPADPRSRSAADMLRQGLGVRLPTAVLARKAGASRRTLERLFLRETGLTFGRWRQRLRLIRSLELLASGQSVTAAASGVGYESTSAFVSAFRRELGTTPGRYFRKQA